MDTVYSARIEKERKRHCHFVRNDIECAIFLPDTNVHSLFIEVLWVKCYFNNMIYYIAGCYHPPKPRYNHSDLHPWCFGCRYSCYFQHITIIESPAVFIVTGDFNSFNADFLEIDFGMSQLDITPTHGNKIIDTFFTSRPDLFKWMFSKVSLKLSIWLCMFLQLLFSATIFCLIHPQVGKLFCMICVLTILMHFVTLLVFMIWSVELNC
jgi:hypothetical protein